jgi:hypothetical protein
MFNIWIEMTYAVFQTSSVFNLKQWIKISWIVNTIQYDRATPTFQRNILPPSSGSKNKLSIKLVISRWQRKQEKNGGREVGGWMGRWVGKQTNSSNILHKMRQIDRKD